MPEPVTTALIAAAVGGGAGKLTEKILAKLENLAADARDKVPDGDRVEPPRPFAGPLLEAAKHHTERGLLRDMFCELLSKGMDAKQQYKAHPAFVRVLEQLSSDEAVLLRAMKDMPKDNVMFGARIRVRDTGSFQVEDLKFASDLPDLAFPQNLELYVGHLEQLNLLQRGLPYENRYASLRASTVADARTAQQGRISFQMSKFGSLFVDACVPSTVRSPSASRTQAVDNEDG